LRLGRNLRFLLCALRTRLVSGRPIFLSHMITSKCDCMCATCRYWTLGERDEMTMNEVCKMLDEARSAGMTDYIVWGGEPLLRSDLPQVVKHANSIGLDVTLLTNGSRLADRIEEIAGELYGIIVSIDHPEPKMHDKLRRQNGIFDKAVEGIKLAKSFEQLNIFINCVISKANVDQLEEMVKLAERLDVKITFEMMEVVKGYNERLALSREETTSAMQKLIHLKEEGRPIANSIAYFESVGNHSGYVCHVPKVLVTVEWDGKVRVCSTIAEEAKPKGNFELGNVKLEPLSKIFKSEEYEKYVKAAERCCKCYLSYPREIAMIYSFNREAIGNFFSKILR